MLYLIVLINVFCTLWNINIYCKYKKLIQYLLLLLSTIEVTEEYLLFKMDQRNFPYAMKNIPVPMKKLYLKILIDKVELLIKQIRWKALFYENETKGTFNYSFKPRKCSRQHKDLITFEDDLRKIISNVEFRRVNNYFQDRLKNDIRSIQSSKTVFFSQKKQETFTKWKNHITKNFWQTTLQEHIDNLTIMCITVLILKRNISQKNLKPERVDLWPENQSI